MFVYRVFFGDDELGVVRENAQTRRYEVGVNGSTYPFRSIEDGAAALLMLHEQGARCAQGESDGQEAHHQPARA